MKDPRSDSFRGWARLIAALWCIAYGVVALTIARLNPADYGLALVFAMVALPGLVAAVSIGRKPG